MLASREGEKGSILAAWEDKTVSIGWASIRSPLIQLAAASSVDIRKELSFAWGELEQAKNKAKKRAQTTAPMNLPTYDDRKNRIFRLLRMVSTPHGDIAVFRIERLLKFGGSGGILYQFFEYLLFSYRKMLE